MSETSSRSHSVRQTVAPLIVWAGVAVTLLACAAISAVLIFAGHAESTSETAEGFRRRLELVAIEHDLLFAADRMEALALLYLVTGTHGDELARAQAEFADRLESSGTALAAFVDSGRLGNEAARQLSGVLVSMRREHPAPATAAESLRAASDLFEGLTWVGLAAPDGEWYDLFDFVHDLQIASSYGFDHVDEYAARWWQLTQPPTDPEVRAQIESVAAFLRALDPQSGDGASTRWSLDRLLDLGRARAHGEELAELVAGLQAHPGAQLMRDTTPFLLHRSSEPGPPPGALYDQMARFSDELRAGAERALALADRRIAAEARRADQRTAAARAAALVVTALAALALIALERHRRRLNRHLRRLAETDGLTGLGNRYALEQHERKRLADTRWGGFALIHLDLDNFKTINDSFGHQVGDRALTEFARCCRHAVRSGDTVARVGGDEFVIVLHGLSEPVREAREVAARIHDSLREPVDLGGSRHLRLQVSIGIATANGAADLDEMMVEADLALYAAKERGCNRRELFADSVRRALVRDLPHALTHDGLGCAFQPQVDLVTGEVVGLEALARWPVAVGPSARSAVVPARKVVEVVEWLNQTPALLRSMLARVESAFADTHGQFEGRFWLNLSPADLAISEAAELLLDTFHAASLPLHRLGIEITESLPIVDFDQAIEVLERLRAAGLAVAIDDFGCGNTPLRHLTRLPLDVVKLDQEVTAKVDSLRSNRVLVSAVRYICEAHGMILLAEGVETEREIEVLRELGVHQAQGYAIAPPLAPADLTEFLARHGTPQPESPAAARQPTKVH